jgi:hypothetical protein
VDIKQQAPRTAIYGSRLASGPIFWVGVVGSFYHIRRRR